MIHIPTPSDVVFLDPQSNLVKSVTWTTGNPVGASRGPSTPAEWKKRGNEHYKRKEWLCAAVAYTEGLKLEPRNHLLLLNRAAAYLELQWINSAAHDAEAVITMNLGDAALKRKAVLRATKAYYSAEKYIKVTRLVKRLPDDTEIKTFLAKASQRLRERDEGKFDWLSMYRQSRAPASHPDVASYQGPVEVKLPRQGDSSGSHGLFTTCAVDAGSLLFVAKPIASYYPEEKPPHPAHQREVFLTYNFMTGEPGNRTPYALVDRVVNRIWDDANVARTFQAMSAGSRFPSATNYPGTFIPPSPLTDPRTLSIDIDIDRIEGMCAMNTFRLADVGSGFNVDQDMVQEIFRETGRPGGIVRASFLLQTLLRTLSFLRLLRRRHGGSSCSEVASWRGSDSELPLRIAAVRGTNRFYGAQVGCSLRVCTLQGRSR